MADSLPDFLIDTDYFILEEIPPLASKGHRKERKRPKRQDYETDEAFGEAILKWRKHRDINNLYVKKSRQKLKHIHLQMEQQILSMQVEIDTLKSLVELLQSSQ